ncbi:chemotaxis protein CheW [Nitrosophilus alvini]|uniref:chemotaxis protein CheW n=1 Tax=Nitrosophilus alvini TaxID=2714855 RepID=UPI00190C97DF|nr:chemotaxis protein CheW [Nitrosophilus alvini]
MTETEVLGIKEDIVEEINTEERVISFRLNDELVGIDIKNVIKITKHMDITPVPKTEEYILGVMNLRGSIVPVVDLKKMLGLESDSEESREFILVIDSDLGNIGLTVDEIVGATSINPEDIHSPPMNSIGIDPKYITGVVLADNEEGNRDLLIMLDIEKLFSKKNEEEE